VDQGTKAFNFMPMPATPHSSSEKPQSLQDASEHFFEAIVGGEFADLSQEQVRAMTATRGNAEDTLAYDYPFRKEPRNIDRTPVSKRK
jgi:hypothetical protein